MGGVQDSFFLWGAKHSPQMPPASQGELASVMAQSLKFTLWSADLLRNRSGRGLARWAQDLRPASSRVGGGVHRRELGRRKRIRLKELR